MPDMKAPAPAVVEAAQAKMDAGAELNQREAAAMEAQEAIDQDRGYRRIEWKPGIWLWQHLQTSHTTSDGDGGEAEMRRWHNEYQMGQLRG